MYFLLLILWAEVQKCLTSEAMCPSTRSTCSTGEKLDFFDRLQALDVKVLQLQKLAVQRNFTKHTTIQGLPRDCEEIHNQGTHVDGVYAISPDGRCPFFVYCDMTHGGWTLIQRRYDGKVSFYQGWEKYVNGFGDVDGEHWLGLEKIHRLTKDGSQLNISTTDWSKKKNYLHVNVFIVHGALTDYKMNVEQDTSYRPGLSVYDDKKFATFDHNYRQTCEKTSTSRWSGRDVKTEENGHSGGWWHTGCSRDEYDILNDLYAQNSYDNKYKSYQMSSIGVKNMNGMCHSLLTI